MKRIEYAENNKVNKEAVTTSKETAQKWTSAFKKKEIK